MTTSLDTLLYRQALYRLIDEVCTFADELPNEQFIKLIQICEKHDPRVMHFSNQAHEGGSSASPVSVTELGGQPKNGSADEQTPRHFHFSNLNKEKE